jgi:HAD superfamily hydrolase (TIGR01509 family)
MRKGLIFDLDGLLIDSEGLQYKAYSRVLAELGVQVTREEYGTYWIAAGRGPEYAVRTYNLPLTPDELRARKDPVYHAVLRAEVTPMPGALAALQRLQGHYRIALATNSNPTDTGFVIDHLSMRTFFDAVVTRNLYERAKPEPDAFVVAARQLGLAPPACIVLEDAYKGILAAHRAGALPIAVPNAFTRDNDFSLAVRVLDSLDELTVALIEELFAEHGVQ